MKFEQKETKKPFVPIIITLETEKEAALLKLIFGSNTTVAKALGEITYEKNSQNKIDNAIDETGLYDFLSGKVEYQKYFKEDSK